MSESNHRRKSKRLFLKRVTLSNRVTKVTCFTESQAYLSSLWATGSSFHSSSSHLHSSLLTEQHLRRKFSVKNFGSFSGSLESTPQLIQWVDLLHFASVDWALFRVSVSLWRFISWNFLLSLSRPKKSEGKGISWNLQQCTFLFHISLNLELSWTFWNHISVEFMEVKSSWTF